MNITINLQKWGNSQGIRIPKAILDLLHWQSNESLSLIAKNNKIIIEKKRVPKKKVSIQELFKDFEGTYIHEEIDWGKPQGKEIW